MGAPDDVVGFVHHAVLQFMPLEETGELANIGAVVFMPRQRAIHYRLLAFEEAGRILNFFAPMRPNVLQQALRQADAALRDAAHEMSVMGLAEHARRRDLWQSVIATKNAGYRFALGGISVTDDGQRVLARLMQNMVRRHIPKASRASPAATSSASLLVQTMWPPRIGVDQLVVQPEREDRGESTPRNRP